MRQYAVANESVNAVIYLLLGYRLCSLLVAHYTLL